MFSHKIVKNKKIKKIKLKMGMYLVIVIKTKIVKINRMIKNLNNRMSKYNKIVKVFGRL